MVFHSGMVRGSRHHKVDRASRDEPLEDHRMPLVSRQGLFKWGDEEYIPGL
jgi:hypothetical protein